MMRRNAILAVVALAGWGCGPPEMVPVGPPGLSYEQVTPEPEEKEAAAAVGEMRAALDTSTPTQEIKPAEPTEPGQAKTTETGLVYETLTPGTGDAAKAGQTAVVRYRGTLTNGTVFDETKGDDTFPFTIGRGAVIKGWDQGVAGMRVGEKRKLTIPPELAYGDTPPNPTIPPKSTLLFDVELVELKSSSGD